MVLSGKKNINHPNFTKKGSFFSNNTMELLVYPQKNDLRIHPRSTCIKNGYLSLANIPIYVNDEIVGLLQLNSLKSNIFTQEIIEFYEDLSDSIGIALDRKNTKSFLQENISKLNNIATNISDCIWSLSLPDLSVLYISPSVINITGYTDQEYINNKDLWIINTLIEDRKIIDKSLKILKKTGISQHERRTICKDGKIIWVKDKAKMVYDEFNNAIRIDGVTQDITKEKKAELKIIKQNLFLETVINSLNHPFNVIDVNTYKVLLKNNYSTFNYSGKNCYELNYNLNKPCNQTGLACPIDTIKKTKQPFITEHMHFDKNDNVIFVEVHASPIFDDEGNLIQIAEYSIDISHRKESEYKLIKAKETAEINEYRFEQAIANANAFVWECDINGVYAYLSNSVKSIVGYEAQNMIGKMSIFDIQKDKNSNKIDILNKIKKNEHISSFVREIITAKGEIIFVSTNAMPIKEEPYGITYYRGTDIVINDIVKYQETLKSYQNELKQLLSTTHNAIEEERMHISRELHDTLGQSLTALRLFLFKQKRDINSEKFDIYKIKQTNDEIINYVDKTIQDVKNISRKIKDEFISKLGFIDALELKIKEIQIASNINITINKKVSNINKSQSELINIYRVIQESITNTLRHSNAQSIKINISQNKNNYIFKVEDDGYGFNIKEVDNKKSLGLINMKERISNLNGKFEIFSIKNLGTTINFTIPKNTKL